MNAKKKAAGKKKFWSWFLGVTAILLLAAGGITWWFYTRVLQPNVFIQRDGASYLYIRTGSNFQDVVQALQEAALVKDTASFRWTAEQMNYTSAVKPGRYKLKDKMSNKELLTLLRSGKQEPVKLVIRPVDSKRELAGLVGRKLEADSLELLELMDADTLLKAMELDHFTNISLFIPDTYEFYWNTDAAGFLRRMTKEYKKFWNAERLKKAKAKGLTPAQVHTLAAIVDKETTLYAEMPVVAGVYLNRLKKDMTLDADPTVKFALGDPGIRRLLNKDLQIEHPYNTYKNKGLPPGPICLPTQQAVNAVLNATDHNYLYFCASPDHPGHDFASTLAQHLINARRYHASLNKRGIKR